MYRSPSADVRNPRHRGRGAWAALWLVATALACGNVALAGVTDGMLYSRDGDLYYIQNDQHILLTDAAAVDTQPALSPNGEEVAFRSVGRAGTTTSCIWIIGVQTGDYTLVTDDSAQDYDPRWKPDGTQIAFESVSRGASGSSAIWVWDRANGTYTQLTNDDGDDHGPSWSPDASAIVFYGQGRLQGGTRLWIVDVLAALASPVDPAAYLLIPTGVDSYEPAWSPDGAEIAYDYPGAVGAVDVASLYDADPAIVTRVLVSGDHFGAAWSPDGAFVAYRDAGASSVYFVDVSTGLSTPVTDGLGVDRDPDWGAMAAAGIAVMPAPPPDFPDTPVNGSSSITLTIAGTGTDTLTVSDITSDNAAFTVSTTPAPPFDLLAQDPDLTQDVTVTFTPTVEGTHTANITITHNAAGSQTVVPVSGTATSAVSPGIAVTPAPLDIGSVEVNLSGMGTLTIAGTGTDTLTVSDITSDNAAFTVSTTPAPPFDLLAQDPDLTQDVTVTFTPTVEGTHTANITITHNAAGSPTVITVTGTGVAATGATITAADAQGQIGGTTTVAVGVSDLTGLGVAAVELVLTYDPTLLTPRNDGTNTTAAATTALIPASWNMSQNVPTAGELRVALAGESTDPIVGGGTLVEVTFDISATATVGATSLLTLTTASLNEGGVSSTAVAGTFTVTQFMYGDVTGNGAVSPYDATWILDCVATELVGGTSVFPVEDAAPPWSPVPLTPAEAREVADVDDDGLITANDAVAILQYVVGLVVELPLPAVPPAPTARALTAAAFDVVQTSARPGARITVSLDASAMSDVRAGELVLDYDAAVLRPADVAFRGADAGVLLSHREGDGRLAAAFASGRAIEGAGAVLEVTFEATRNVSRPIESAIRASHLRLNGAKVETGFAHTFRVEPFQTRLMANYPNPFNPETWIPFELAEAADVTIRVYGVDGRLVRTLELGRRDVGEYAGRDEAAYWDGANASGEAVASGVYIYELTAGDYHAVRRMVVRK